MKKKNYLKYIIYILSVFILILIDQFSKILAVNNLKGKAPYVIIKDIFEFSYLQNQGAAWGMLSGKQTLFFILTLLVIIFLIYLLIKTPLNKKYFIIYIVNILLFSGAVGNFIDRISMGYVRDFIYFKLIDFPVFNIADCYVSISMILFAIVFIFIYKEQDFDYLKLNIKK